MNDRDLRTFARVLGPDQWRARLRARGVSQRRLAEQAIVSQSYVSEVVNGKRPASPRLIRAAIDLGVVDPGDGTLARAESAVLEIDLRVLATILETREAAQASGDQVLEATSLAAAKSTIQRLARTFGGTE